MGFHEHMNTNERASNTLTYSNHNFSPLDSRTICLWNDPFVELSKSYTSGNVHQMHQIRFPTPPTTPPKEVKLSTYKIQIQQGSGQEQRTDSVIMKVGEAVSKIAQMNNIKVNDSVDYMTTSNSFICNWTQCKRTFATLETLASHVTKVHAIASVIDGLYYCGWDGCPRIDRGFNARYKMLVHVRTHTKEKPHQCNLCEKCFSRAENLKIHIRSHSGEKPYICSYEGCQKAYSNSSDRFKHTRTHSMEKPYFCKIPGCQKRYTDPSSLRKHVKTFKHSEQLINNDVHMPSATSPISIESELLEKVRNDSSSEICNGQCYIDLDPVEFCCLETNKLNYYYFDRKSAHPSYWISDDQNNSVQCSGHYTVENQPHSILDMTTESPLDLRINRIA